jgi:hypothetical protein
MRPLPSRFRSVHLAAQDIGGFEQIAFELGQRQGHESGFRWISEMDEPRTIHDYAA